WDGGLQELPARVLKLAVPRAILSLSNDPTGGCWAAACLPGEPDWAGSLGEPDGIYQNHGGDWSLAVAGDTLRAAGMPMDARVQVAAPAGDGSLWIGTSHGLWRYTSGVPKEQMGDAGRADVRALLVLAPHELLVGACRGLFVGRTGVMAPVAGLEQDVVVALARDAVGETVWAATAAGLVHLERTGDGWAIRRRFTADSSGLASDHVTSLALEVSGEKTRVWIGTAGGLCCYVHQRGGS
ncbi:MAG TPA: hypothetical protein VLA19_02435, partial [Herpetosiphonaceae bacterium]|nr:hypothetical protein [Herpetosiphonaceae bacterium]